MCDQWKARITRGVSSPIGGFIQLATGSLIWSEDGAWKFRLHKTTWATYLDQKFFLGKRMIDGKILYTKGPVSWLVGRKATQNVIFATRMTVCFKLFRLLLIWFRLPSIGSTAVTANRSVSTLKRTTSFF